MLLATGKCSTADERVEANLSPYIIMLLRYTRKVFCFLTLNYQTSIIIYGMLFFFSLFLALVFNLDEPSKELNM